MRLLAPFIVVLIATVWSGSAFALPGAPVGSVEALYCIGWAGISFYDPNSKDAPPRVAASFSGPGAKLTFRTCQDYEGNTHYFMREPVPADSGICRIREKEIFPGDATDHAEIDVIREGGDYPVDLFGWKEQPPTKWQARHYSAGRGSDFALLADRPCPPGDSQSYVPVDHVTDGTFKSFYHLWENISQSPKAFNKAFEHVDVLKSVPGTRELDKAVLLGDLYGDLFFSKKGPLTVWNMACSRDCSVLLSDLVIIHFDVDEKGLIITHLSEAMRI